MVTASAGLVLARGVRHLAPVRAGVFAAGGRGNVSRAEAGMVTVSMWRVVCCFEIVGEPLCTFSPLSPLAPF